MVNILHGANLKAYKRQRKPELTESMKKKRIKFARKFSNHDWIHTLMTDETDFYLDENIILKMIEFGLILPRRCSPSNKWSIHRECACGVVYLH